MFNRQLKSTGRDYSLTIALLAAAVFAPAALAIFRAPSALLLSIAGVCSSVCVLLAWLNWRSNSKLTIPTLEDEHPPAL